MNKRNNFGENHPANYKMNLTIVLSEQEKYLVTITPEGEMLDQEMIQKRKYFGEDHLVNHLNEIKIIYLK